MQTHAHGAGRHAEFVRQVDGGEPFEQVTLQRRRVGLAQRLQRRREPRVQFTLRGDGQRVRHRRPRLGARGIDHAPFATPLLAHAVGEDPEQPRHQRPRFVPFVAVLDRREERRLHGILGVVPVGTEMRGEPPELGSGPVEDVAEQAHVAGATVAKKPAVDGSSHALSGPEPAETSPGCEQPWRTPFLKLLGDDQFQIGGRLTGHPGCAPSHRYGSASPSISLPTEQRPAIRSHCQYDKSLTFLFTDTPDMATSRLVSSADDQ
ncbi:MAG: hypothetical protein U1F60_13430 [Planctomycetota bacterium]